MKLSILLVLPILLSACTAQDGDAIKQLEDRINALEDENQQLKGDEGIEDQESEVYVPEPVNNPTPVSEPQPSQPQCTYDDWSCEDWSACANGIQQRSCKLKNNCVDGVTDPETERTCTGQKDACTKSDWKCNSWGYFCSNGKMTRTCTLMDTDCTGSEDVKPVIEKDCEEEIEPEAPSPTEPNVEDTLWIMQFIAKAENNTLVMQNSLETYRSSPSHYATVEQISTIIFTHKGYIAQIQYLGDLSKTRRLTNDEFDKVNSLMKQVNDLIGDFNNKFD